MMQIISYSGGSAESKGWGIFKFNFKLWRLRAAINLINKRFDNCLHVPYAAWENDAIE